MDIDPKKLMESVFLVKSDTRFEEMSNFKDPLYVEVENEAGWNDAKRRGNIPLVGLTISSLEQSEDQLACFKRMFPSGYRVGLQINLAGSSAKKTKFLERLVACTWIDYICLMEHGLTAEKLLEIFKDGFFWSVYSKSRVTGESDSLTSIHYRKEGSQLQDVVMKDFNVPGMTSFSSFQATLNGRPFHIIVEKPNPASGRTFEKDAMTAVVLEKINPDLSHLTIQRCIYTRQEGELDGIEKELKMDEMDKTRYEVRLEARIKSMGQLQDRLKATNVQLHASHDSENKHMTLTNELTPTFCMTLQSKTHQKSGKVRNQLFTDHHPLLTVQGLDAQPAQTLIPYAESIFVDDVTMADLKEMMEDNGIVEYHAMKNWLMREFEIDEHHLLFIKAYHCFEILRCEKKVQELENADSFFLLGVEKSCPKVPITDLAPYLSIKPGQTYHGITRFARVPSGIPKMMKRMVECSNGANCKSLYLEPLFEIDLMESFFKQSPLLLPFRCPFCCNLPYHMPTSTNKLLAEAKSLRRLHEKYPAVAEAEIKDSEGNVTSILSLMEGIRKRKYVWVPELRTLLDNHFLRLHKVARDKILIAKVREFLLKLREKSAKGKEFLQMPDKLELEEESGNDDEELEDDDETVGEEVESGDDDKELDESVVEEESENGEATVGEEETVGEEKGQAPKILELLPFEGYQRPSNILEAMKRERAAQIALFAPQLNNTSVLEDSTLDELISSFSSIDVSDVCGVCSGSGDHVCAEVLLMLAQPTDDLKTQPMSTIEDEPASDVFFENEPVYAASNRSLEIEILDDSSLDELISSVSSIYVSDDEPALKVEPEPTNGLIDLCIDYEYLDAEPADVELESSSEFSVLEVPAALPKKRPALISVQRLPMKPSKRNYAKKLSNGLYQCKSCSKQFVNEGARNQHQESHYGKQFWCQCGCGYSRRVRLMEHLKKGDGGCFEVAGPVI